MWLLLCWFCCMGRKVQPWRRAVPAMDMDDVRWVHVPVRMACSVCVSGSAAYALECWWDLEVCTSLCPCWFLTPLAPRPASRRVVAAPRRCVASCAGIRILSQEVAKPCISELSVLPQVEVSLSEGDQRCKKMIFLAAIRGKSQRWVTLSCNAHLVSTG